MYSVRHSATSAFAHLEQNLEPGHRVCLPAARNPTPAHATVFNTLW
jgi:hypothetical protein